MRIKGMSEREFIMLFAAVLIGRVHLIGMNLECVWICDSSKVSAGLFVVRGFVWNNRKKKRKNSVNRL